MKQQAGGKHMEYDCFPKTLKFEISSQTQKETERNRFLHVLHRNDNYIGFTLKMH